MGKCILILGGARGGKSRFAREMAARLGGKVLFVATAEARDDEMKQRIEKHRQERPADWRTVEAPAGIGGRIREEIGGCRVVIVDCITLLVANVIGGGNAGVAEGSVNREIDELIRCIDDTAATFILVSNEVGLGLVPENRLGRLYRDLLGGVNQTLAERAEQVYFMVSGVPFSLKKEDT